MNFKFLVFFSIFIFHVANAQVSKCDLCIKSLDKGKFSMRAYLRKVGQDEAEERYEAGRKIWEASENADERETCKAAQMCQ
ncbi:unnamed protein product [Caenorhabditis angaria]|uniref:Saposin B-type domain-containing protein n=1 Tax=Caenorhabditis angaria TaxID=860376 RepID=A0A9P1I4R3_9PELO|nr:unnamed protein product [Caenorhabditis angaria]